MTALGRRRELIEGAGRRGSELRLIVGAGSCGQARGADAVYTALRHAVVKYGLAADVVAGGCNGMCYGQVLVTVKPRGGPFRTYGHVTPELAPALLAHAVQRSFLRSRGKEASEFEQRQASSSAPPANLPPLLAVESEPSPEEPLNSDAGVPFLAGQARLVTLGLADIDPGDIYEATFQDAYAMLAQMLDEFTPEQVIAMVEGGRLLGRGGAYFPTAAKWKAARAAAGEPKWLVANAEEGEPGVFKDRHLLESNPHRVLEGVLLAAYAIGASRGIFYINGEAHLAQRRVALAVEQAREVGLLGERILGTDFSFELEIRHGAGGYILGEETALLESIEGRRAMPRVRPPFPVERGLWGRPTVINNVETLATIPLVVHLGGERFASVGLPDATGTKLIGLSGNIARPGLAEVEFGRTMRHVVETIGGGVPDGRQLKAVLIGGPSGVFVPPSALDEPIKPRGIVPPGTGGWVVLDDRQSIPALVRQLTEFNMVESCGKCTPCREGTVRLLALLDRFVDHTATPADLDQLRSLGEVVEYGSLCGLGQMAPRPIASALEHFPDEWAVGSGQ